MGQAFGTTNSHNDEQRHYTRKEIGMSIVLFVIVGVRRWLWAELCYVIIRIVLGTFCTGQVFKLKRERESKPIHYLGLASGLFKKKSEKILLRKIF